MGERIRQNDDSSGAGLPVRLQTKLIREGDYAAEVDVSLMETEEGWSPYLTLEDAQKLDRVREALRLGDVKAAVQHARVFLLTRVSA